MFQILLDNEPSLHLSVVARVEIFESTCLKFSGLGQMASDTSADHWSDDLLDRKKDSIFLYNFLMSQVDELQRRQIQSSYVLNLDADWCVGKTFFLNRFAKDLKGQDHIVVEINAWHDDHFDDPYIAIMAALDGAFSPFIKKDNGVRKAWKAAKTNGGAIALRAAGVFGKGLLKKTLGTDFQELAGLGTESVPIRDALSEGIAEVGGGQIEKLFDASMEDLIENFKRTDTARNSFRTNLEKTIETLSGGVELPIFVLIDELDRCRPTYAVGLLERVKHLFSVPNIVFVFATNSAQLRHSVAGAYGAGFDGFRYLKRFFDRSYVFMPPSIKGLVESEVRNFPKGRLRSPSDNVVDLLVDGFDLCGLDIRSIKKILNIMSDVLYVWSHRERAEIALLFPLCVHFFQNDTPSWPDGNSLHMGWMYYRKSVDQFGQNSEENSINMHEVYVLALDTMDDLSKASSMFGSRKRSLTENYVYDLFAAEWNGVAISPRQRSVQSEMLSLVANAGRMLPA